MLSLHSWNARLPRSYPCSLSPFFIRIAAVLDLKAAIASQTDVEEARQRLIYSGSFTLPPIFHPSSFSLPRSHLARRPAPLLFCRQGSQG
jgi:hypothetical protein